MSGQQGQGTRHPITCLLGQQQCYTGRLCIAHEKDVEPCWKGLQGRLLSRAVSRGDTASCAAVRAAMTSAGQFTALLESRPDWIYQPQSVGCLLTRKEGILKGGAAHPEGVGFNHQRSKPRPTGLPFLQGTAAACSRPFLPLPSACPCVAGSAATSSRASWASEGSEGSGCCILS